MAILSQKTAVVPTGPIEDVQASSKLEDQAAIAALYVTKYAHRTDKEHGQKFLDGDHKLSSAGAAASLKYASPQDLPSYPSIGLKDNTSAAGAAASLGWANQKPLEHWKPDPSASASAAAMLAKDYKMAPAWQPEQSASGVKAALFAHRDSGKVEVWKPEATDWGNSAANQAFKKERARALSPQLDYGYTAIGRQGSLMAATGAMFGSRKRADSTPNSIPKAETYPDEANAAANALSAATLASSKKRNEISETAVAMARQIYSVQQRQIEAANIHQHAKQASTSTSGEDVQPVRFNNLQEAAQKLAQERLSKLHDEHATNREYRDYYGGNFQASLSRLSVRGRARRRASSVNGLDEDREQSNKIRAQMSLFSSNLSNVDAQKRQEDRENLIAIAQRNVTKSLHGMDEKVFADTGKVAPSLLDDWELKAHAAAQAKSDARMENYGKVNIGGGRFMNQSAIDLVATQNVQPVLDEINEKAEKERVRQAELKLEQENEKRKAREEKAREKEEKDINRKLKQQDKDEEKARKAEEKRMSGLKHKRNSTAQRPDGTEPAFSTDAVAQPESPTLAERREVTTVPTPVRTSMEDSASTRKTGIAAPASPKESTPVSPSSPQDGSKVKKWLKTRFSRRMSKVPKSPEKDAGSDRGFVGGAALTGASANSSSGSLGPAVQSRAEEPEGVEEPVEEPAESSARPMSGVSSVSAVSNSEVFDEEFQEARDGFDEDLVQPTFPVQKSSSPVRDSKFHEVM
ncbi:hypothetical protein B7494_g5825 [Chlorociboria aeruginascens]|nr:hypothetical protein B7494_g5825 [Chlorociboria aeruginascens]